MQQHALRGGAVLAVLSIIIAAVANLLHGGTDPGNLQIVLPEYAANPNWKAVHLGQFIGFMAMIGSLAALLNYLKEKSGTIFALLGLIAAIVAASTYAANHAVDGVAIQYVAEVWSSATGDEQTQAYQLAETVRHIEQGLSGFNGAQSGHHTAAVRLGDYLKPRFRPMVRLGGFAGRKCLSGQRRSSLLRWLLSTRIELLVEHLAIDLVGCPCAAALA